MLNRLLPSASLITIAFITGSHLFAQGEPPLSPNPNDDPLWAQYIDSEQKLSDMENGTATADDQNKAVADLTDLANKVVAKFPKDPRTWQVKLTILDLKGHQDHLTGKKPDIKEAEARYSPLANDNDAPKDIRAEAQIRITGPKIDLLLNGPTMTQDTLSQVDKEIETFQTQFKGEPLLDRVVPQLRTMELEALHASGNSDLLKAQLTKLASDSNPDVAQMASQMQGEVSSMEDVLKKPIDLKFTAVDGSDVDFTKLRGKVVLLDFWATWCPPCVAEVPNVVAAYKKYHDQGFEVIGISLDQDKNQLLSFTKANEMVWPQAFDGKSFEGDIPASFGIEEIPTMILVNKQGQMFPHSVRDDLDSTVAKLLKG